MSPCYNWNKIYARKYALNGLFNIDDSKDSDTTNTHEKQQTEQKYYCKICKQQIKEENSKQGTVVTHPLESTTRIVLSIMV